MKKFIAIMAALTAVFGITAMSAYAAPKVTEEQAKQAALKHAGLTPEQAQFKAIKYDSEEGGGRGEYKLRFYAGNEEFKYEIDAQSGGIMSCSQDMGLNAELYGGTQQGIGAQKAIETALARVPGAKQSDVKKLKFDRDDKKGTAQYEGKIFYDKTDYKFEIDAQNGEILSWEIEY